MKRRGVVRKVALDNLRLRGYCNHGYNPGDKPLSATEPRTPVQKWLLLTYKIPREPTAGRVYVWRKMKQLGAVALQDAVWVLPASPRTQEHFQWLAAEIVELGGEATLFVSRLALASEANGLVEQFEKPVK